MSKRRNRSALARTESAPRVVTHDSWMNPTTGVGGPNDKAAAFMFVGGLDSLYSPYIFSEMYEQDDIIATIVDALVDEAMRRGFKVESDVTDPKAKERIQDWIDRFGVKEKVTEARKWARLHGGSAMLIGSDDVQQWMPLKPGAKIRHLTNFERDELNPARYYDDPFADNFGEVSHYRLSPTSGGGSSRSGLLVHESRLIRFYGVRTTRTKRIMNQGWGSSVLLRPIKAVSQFYGAFASSLAALANSQQDVYKIKGFSEMMKAGGEALLKKRLEILDKFRSAIRAIAMDADGEDFVRSSLALTGVEGILDKVMLRLAAAAKMPVSVLMGQAPAGLNATGESDQRIWQARAQTEQRDVFTPALTRLMRLAFQASNGPTLGVEPGTWSIQWPSLWEPTAIEAAQIDQANAATDQIYIDKQILKPSDVAKARFRGEQNNRVLLSDERIAELEEAEGGGADDAVITATPGAPNLIAPPGSTLALPAAETTDEDDTDEVDSDIDESNVEFARQMTEAGFTSCEHGKTNRCRICGIERARTIVPGPEGKPVFGLGWKAIGASPVTPNAPASQPAVVATAGAPNAIAPAPQAPND